MNKSTDPTLVTALFYRDRYYLLMNNGILYIDKGIIQTNIANAAVINDKIYLTNFNDDRFELVTDQALHLQHTLASLPFEILDMISDQLNLPNQINFRLVSKKFSTLPLTNFWDFGKSYAITNQIIKNNPFIRKLDLYCNMNIDRVENLTHLKLLNIVNSRVKTVSDLPNLEMVTLNNDNVQIYNIDQLKIVRLSKDVHCYYDGEKIYYTSYTSTQRIYPSMYWFSSWNQLRHGRLLNIIEDPVPQLPLSAYVTDLDKKRNLRNYDQYHRVLKQRKNRLHKTSMKLPRSIRTKR